MDCILFVVSLTDFDEFLYEDDRENRLRESVRVWKQTVNHESFKDTWVILFLNKFDQFRQRYFYDKKVIKPRFEYRLKAPKVEDEEGVWSLRVVLQLCLLLMFASRIRTAQKQWNGLRTCSWIK